MYQGGKCRIDFDAHNGVTIISEILFARAAFTTADSKLTRTRSGTIAGNRSRKTVVEVYFALCCIPYGISHPCRSASSSFAYIRAWKQVCIDFVCFAAQPLFASVIFLIFIVNCVFFAVCGLCFVIDCFFFPLWVSVSVLTSLQRIGIHQLDVDDDGAKGLWSVGCGLRIAAC